LKGEKEPGHMITELHVRNFKSVKAVDLKCSRINVFIGEPNTGKIQHTRDNCTVESL
jgi:predicted ATPase